MAKNLKKDPFNGKVKEEYIKYTKNSLIWVSFITLLLSVFLLFMVIFYPPSTGGLIGMIIIICIGFISGIFYPIITVALIKSYPKHRKLTKLFIADFVLKDGDEK